MISKDDCLRLYAQYKDTHGAIPMYKDFLKFADINKRQLTELFGRDAYSNLQKAAGDKANNLDLKRTPRETIMRQYGDLALELGYLPNSSDWMHHQLRPSVEGLAKKPHSMRWSEFPQKFSEWVKSEHVSGYNKALDLISKAISKSDAKIEEGDREFDRLVREIKLWSPPRRRNVEETYKAELRSRLGSLGYEVKEEVGDSNVDLLIGKKYAIEIKKAPNLSEYDRLFGQLARHLQHHRYVVALILGAPGEDNFKNFASLVDSYLNKDNRAVEVIKK
jgi:hypothetical protein